MTMATTPQGLIPAEFRPAPRHPGWICVQAGHRERYAVPEALHRVGALDRLVTDVWAPPGSGPARLAGGPAARKLRDRFNLGLRGARVTSFTWGSLAWEAAAAVRKVPAEPRGVARGLRWARLAPRALRRAAPAAGSLVFAYCYEALEVFACARGLGCTAILGQMDPGPVEDQKVAEVVRRWPQFRSGFRPGSAAYYARWRQECDLARHIIVNSAWSRAALEQAGIAAAKLVEIPLVFTPGPEARAFVRTYPAAFGPLRPLRVLFLGQCILRKGIAETIEAAGRLSGRPVEFVLVGNTDIEGFSGHFGAGRIRHWPRVSRSECDRFYKEADVFLFPTHSDGFGLTQLEAQAWGLPIIASAFCSQVVVPGRTGWCLPEVSSDAIVRTVEEILDHPAELARRSAAITPWPFSIDQLGQRLTDLGRSPTPTP